MIQELEDVILTCDLPKQGLAQGDIGTVVLVILVIFVFLRNVSATVIPSLALPMSIIGTFAVMYLLGYSMNNLSLMALTLAVGFVVDDAIVVLENIVRHREMGQSQVKAALVGARQIYFAAMSASIAILAIFLPVLLCFLTRTSVITTGMP